MERSNLDLGAPVLTLPLLAPIFILFFVSAVAAMFG
jgi:hypothetical protein